MRHRFVDDPPRRTTVCARIRHGQHTPACEDDNCLGCLHRCLVRGEHADHCDGGPDQPCTGCRPRYAATDLTVCENCSERTEKAIGRLPALVAHIRQQTEPGRGGDGPKVQVSKTPPAPTRLGAVDAAGLLHAELVRWCDTVRYARGPQFRGPGVDGNLTGLTERVHPPTGRRSERLELLAPEPGCEGPVAVRVTDLVDRLEDKATWQDDTARCRPVQATEKAAAWLTTHLPWALGQDWAAELVDDILDTLRRAENQWSPLPKPERAEADCFDCESPLYRHSGENGFGDEYVCSGCRKRYPYANYVLSVKARMDRERERVIAEAAASGEVA